MSSKSKKYHLVYPHQLFNHLFSFSKDTIFLLIEDPLFFADKEYPRKFHKQKIVLHRASMRSLEHRLLKKGFHVQYFEFSDYPDPIFISHLFKKEKNAIFTVYDPVDHVLESRLKKSFSDVPLFSIVETPNFLTSTTLIKDFFKDKKKYIMSSFYIYQRKRLSLLIENNKPVGGKWSFDAENRKKLPKGLEIPAPLPHKSSRFIKEAIQYTNQHFAQNPGRAEEFNYPTDHAQAKKAYEDFLDNRFALFGAYEDAIAKNETTLFHSNISASLNIGLLCPTEVITMALAKKDTIPLASLEGFIRQIVSWREFMRAVYIMRGAQLRSSNFFNHKKTLPASWYEGTTGIEPVDCTIKKVIAHAYCHHIERLMILGNCMLLLSIDPHDVYGWFMDLFIDAYDWVMVPNVYAMSQYADGGTITTKPYFSSSNYIIKMSDYKKGAWSTVWDSLFYNFLQTHRTTLSQNPRLRLMLKNLDRLSIKRHNSLKKY